MRRYISVVLLLALISILPRNFSAQAARSTPALLTAADRVVAAHAARIADGHPHEAVRWAMTSRRVNHAAVGPDGRTVELRFRDGARADLLPATPVGGGDLPVRTLIATHQTAQPGPGRAVVLEPFAKQLGDGPTAGQSEADLLTRAGFKVDIYRNSDVTVSLLLKLSQYSLVYMKTHAGVLPGGDAVIAVGDTATAPYVKQFGKNAYYNTQDPNAPTVLGQVFVDGGDGGLFNAIRAKFVSDYLSPFPNSSLFFLNGCDILLAPVFLNALQSRNLAAVLTWDQEVRADAAERGLDYTLDQMAAGATLDQAVQDAIADGVGTAYTANGPAHLRYNGIGTVTLQDALMQSLPAPTPTPDGTVTPTPTPSPTSTPVPSPPALKVKIAHHSVRAGQKQKIVVTTASKAYVKIALTFPNRARKTHTGHAGGGGTLSWRFTEPRLKGKSTSHTVKVAIAVRGSGGTRHVSKSYLLK